MKKRVLGALALTFAVSPGIAFSQVTLTAVDITEAEQKAVLAYVGGSSDRMIKMLDVGDYQLGVGIQRRGKTGGAPAAPAAPAAPGAAAANAAAAAARPACGVPGTPSPNAVRAIMHDFQTEVYIILNGGGTLVTGGQMVNGRMNDPETETVKILNGPTCSGFADGPGVVTRDVKAGDIIVVPPNVPHNWTVIPDHVEYLTVRTDAKKMLPTGYVHPAIKK